MKAGWRGKNGYSSVQIDGIIGDELGLMDLAWEYLKSPIPRQTTNALLPLEGLIQCSIETLNQVYQELATDE